MKHSPSGTGGWIRRRLDEVAVLQTGMAKSPRRRRDAVTRPFLRVANVQDGHLDLQDVHSIEVERSQLGRYELQSGDVLMTEGGDFDKLGRGTVWRGEIPGCVHQNHVFAVRPNPRYLLPEFLAAWTASSAGRRFFKACSKQTTNLASINASQVRAAPLLLPSIEVQQEIVEVLSLSESLIATTNELMLRRSAYQRRLTGDLLSGQRRYPKYENSKWRTVRLQSAFTERDECGRDDLPLLAITGGRGIVPRVDLARRDSSAIDKSNYKRIVPGDIGYNTMRMWQGVSGLASLEGIVSPAYTVITPRSDIIDSAFAAHLFKSPIVVHRFLRLSQGLVDDTLNLKFPMFAQVSVDLPSLEEQRVLAAILDCAVREVQLLEQLVSELRNQRRAVTDRLMAGPTR